MKHAKKGFTLVELIVSIALLAVIGVSIGIYLNKVNKNRANDEYENYLNKVKSATNVYVSENKTIEDELESNSAYVIITVSDLKNSGLLDSNIKDPSGKAGEKIKVSLDDNGSLVVEYPTEALTDFLKLDNVKLKLNQGQQSVSCFDLSELDTFKFGYINIKGKLVKPYLKPNVNLKCNQKNDMLVVDTTKVGTYSIKYDYQTQDGVWKSATRKIIVGDSVPPIIKNVTVTPNGWTNKDKKISATISDEDSGIGAYTIKKGEVDCNSTTYTGSQRKAKVELDISATASENGKYTICAKDVSDNVQTTVVDVSQIDKFAPKVTSITSDQGSSFSSSITITATATDDYNGVTSESVSGIIAYQFTTSSRVPTSGWIIEYSDSSITEVFSPDANTTYYFWVKDAAGNISSSTGASITISKLGIKRVATVSNKGLYSSDVNGLTHHINGMAEYIYGEASVGKFNSASNNGSTLFVYGTADSYIYSYACTLYRDSIYDDAIPEEVCTNYKCYYGGDLGRDNKCYNDFGVTFRDDEYGNCHCKNGWALECDTDRGCLKRKHYTRTTTTYWVDEHPPEIITKITADTNASLCANIYSFGSSISDTNVTWECTWDGDYDADCASTGIVYSCPYDNSHMVGTSCYHCPDGADVNGDYQCPYDGTCYATRYQYEYSISYWEKR